MTGQPPVPVAVAVIRDTMGRVLVARRSPHQHAGGKLEFPGGKIESGESVEAALVRELEEELGLQVAPEDVSREPLIVIEHAYPEKRVVLDVREVKHFQGAPHGRQGQAVSWMVLAQLDPAEFPEANAAIIERLRIREEAPVAAAVAQSGTTTSGGSLTHLNAQGEAHMVDVAGKPITARRAVAEARVRMQSETLEMITQGRHKKGDVLAVCRIAGIQAAKRTAELIPLCHTINLTSVKVALEPQPSLPGIRIVAECGLADRTGVEMEALTAASVAALTLYDMCKAVDRGMVIEGIRLLEKDGGRSGHWKVDED